MDWFLYDKDLRQEEVKKLNRIIKQCLLQFTYREPYILILTL